MHSFSEQFVGSSAARGVYGKEKEFGSNGVHEVEFPRQFFRSERPSAITCVADSQASTSISRQPRELLVPIPQLVEARVIFAAAPALGHYQEGHPESNERVPSILEALERGKLTPEVRNEPAVSWQRGFKDSEFQSSITGGCSCGSLSGLC